jgi:hypothetical protein
VSAGPTFDGFERITLGMSDEARVVLFDALPAEVQDACWRQLGVECAAAAAGRPATTALSALRSSSKEATDDSP